jgi:4-amino-4-deoxy-L-arabinose transferase-like glycosyltransferase
VLAAQIIPLAILISISVWVSLDARKRGMSMRWGIGVGLLLLVVLPLYFLVRKKMPKCPDCGSDMADFLSRCEDRAQSIQEDPNSSRAGRILG